MWSQFARFHPQISEALVPTSDAGLPASAVVEWLSVKLPGPSSKPVDNGEPVQGTKWEGNRTGTQKGDMPKEEW